MSLIEKKWNEFKKSASFIKKIVGKRGAYWIAAVIVFGALLGGVEYSVALFIQYLIAALGLAPSMISSNFISSFVGSDLKSVLLFLIGIGIVRAMVQFMFNQASMVVSEICSIRLRMILMLPVLAQSGGEYRQADKLHNFLAEVIPNTIIYIFTLVALLGQVIQMFVLAYILIDNAWKEAAVGLGGLFVLGFVVKKITYSLQEIVKHLPGNSQEASSSLERVVRNWFMVRVHGTISEEQEQIKRRLKLGMSGNLKSQALINLSSVLPAMFGILLIALILYISKSYFSTPSTTLIMFIYLYIRFVQQVSGNVTQVGRSINCFPYFIISRDYLGGTDQSFFNIALQQSGLISWLGRWNEDNSSFDQLIGPTTPQNKLSRAQHQVSRTELPGVKVEFTEVSFSYPSNQTRSLENINFQAKSGAVIGLTGTSGSGKSTFLSLLMGINSPEQGVVLIDSLTAADFLSTHSNKIGYVGPDPYLHTGTLKANLCYGNGVFVSDEEIFEVLKLVELSDIVNNLPGGLDFILSENISSLSTGQKQRVSLARALLRKPQLLVLDEPTANLDEKTEMAVVSLVAKLKWRPTIFIASHREAALSIADTVLKFESGKLSRF